MRTLLIDNYDSYTYNLFQLLAQVNNAEPTVVTNDARLGELDLDSYDNIVISPGPGHPARPRDFGNCAEVLTRATVPVLGVCLGHQGLALHAGGRVVAAPTPRHGHVSRVRHNDDLLFADIPTEFSAVRYHSLTVAEPLPADLAAIAWSEDNVVMALRHRRLPRWGVQFHPESIETEYGVLLLRNFRDLSTRDLSTRDSSTRFRPERTVGSNQRYQRYVLDNLESDVAPVRQAPVRQAPVPHPPVPHPPVRQAPVRRYVANVARLAGGVDAEAAFVRLFGNAADAFWLDSSRVESGLSRFSFLGDGSGPLAEVVAHRVGTGPETIFDYLQRELRRRVIDAPELPFDFTGGYVGYFGYELKAETLGCHNRHTAPYPDATWLFADRFVVVDHQAQQTYLVALSEDDPTARAAATWLAATETTLRTLPALPDPVEPTSELTPRPARDRDRYLGDIETCHRHLREGESYEINLTSVVEIAAGPESGLETYRRLRRLNPAPYSAYLRTPHLEVACSSPERFLRITADGLVETKPIKGTAPRGATAELDALARTRLAGDRKTRAENLMIVDLLRNDLGRVCAVGSVEVPVLMAVESYQTLHHLVSTVRGALRPELDAIDCIRACFPGGSMTGAPKLRTCEIIDALEDGPRGVYSGAIGFLGCNGSADLNVVIRTMVLTDGEWRVGAGGAIVLDSDPAAEYDEMLLKAAASIRALGHPAAAVQV